MTNQQPPSSIDLGPYIRDEAPQQRGAAGRRINVKGEHERSNGRTAERADPEVADVGPVPPAERQRVPHPCVTADIGCSAQHIVAGKQSLQPVPVPCVKGVREGLLERQNDVGGLGGSGGRRRRDHQGNQEQRRDHRFC